MGAQIGEFAYFTATADPTNQCEVSDEVVNEGDEAMGDQRNLVGVYSEGDEVARQYFGHEYAMAARSTPTTSRSASTPCCPSAPVSSSS